MQSPFWACNPTTEWAPLLRNRKESGRYDVIKDASKLALRKKHGTQIQAKAKEGTVFYHRMASGFRGNCGPQQWAR